MEIRKERQFNQSMGKYKILSTAAGVGSIITTKWGGFIMPLSIDNWKFIEVVSNKIRALPKPLNLKEIQDNCGVELIDDPRFVDYLAENKGFSNLRCFAAVPHIQLTESNLIKRKGNPWYESIKARMSMEMDEDMFYIPAILFPRWFLSSNFEIKPLSAWRKDWQNKRCNDGKLDFFVPPRDPNKKTYRKYKNENLRDDAIYGLLKQVPLVLICPNGHISDIPWYHYFCAALKHERMDDENGFELFGYQCDDCECGGEHSLKWLNSRNQAESWGTLKCSKCGKSVSLAGIMNIKPLCRGERPWLNQDNVYERCTTQGVSTKMQVAMITSNSIYYANGFSSLYIPKDFIPIKDGQLSEDARTALSKVTAIYNTRLSRDSSLTKEAFWKKSYDNCALFIEDADINWNLPNLSEFDYNSIKKNFLGLVEKEDDPDSATSYRLSEFEVFTDPGMPTRISRELEFEEIALPDPLASYFRAIKQVNVLSLTSIQLGFGRVSMPASRLVDGTIVPPGDEMKPIFNGVSSDVYVLPANRTFGEGLFFAFDMERVNQWATEHNLEDYYKSRTEPGSIGDFLYSEMSLYGRAKFYLLHTFSHVLMKELEFSCGYPTASLCERLYYSDKMCGVLIYTADGAEGSMGGLVWQGQPNTIKHIIELAMKRAVNCSSDPLCWENKDGLNRASCFGCTMVSETSCEHANMALDRRALVDDEFGFFKKMVALL